jgi:hypothetical protein
MCPEYRQCLEALRGWEWKASPLEAPEASPLAHFLRAMQFDCLYVYGMNQHRDMPACWPGLIKHTTQLRLGSNPWAK